MMKTRWLVPVVTFSLIAGACTSGGSDTAEPEAGSGTSSIPEVGSQLDFEFDFVAPDPDPTLIPLDEHVRAGHLDNGMAYYLRHNERPGGRVDLRLVVNAGAGMQEQKDAGLAHFVEHMLFNGTQNYPDNTLDLVLQRLGLQIGPDFNAYTSVDETVYQLTIANDSESVNEAFRVLADWSMAADMEADAVAAERGVVREERRSRLESGSGKLALFASEIRSRGSDYENLNPAGTAESILATSEQDVRRFYDRWYRPDQMAVVVVGDLDIDEMEEEIKAHFEEFGSRGDDAERVELLGSPKQEAIVDRFVHPELVQQVVYADFWMPVWDLGTVGGERLDLLETVMMMILDTRSREGVEQGNVRAFESFVSLDQENRETMFLSVAYIGEDPKGATEDLFAGINDLLVSGPTDEELERTISSLRSSFDQYRDAAGTIQDGEFASEYVEHFLTGMAYTPADEWHSRVTDLLEDFTTGDVSNHLRYLMSLSAPIVVAFGPDEESVPSVVELEGAMAAGLERSGLPREAAVLAEIDELMARPEVVDEGKRVEIPELGGFALRFDNGVTGIFQYSSISENEVTLEAQSSGGWSTLEPGVGAIADTIAEAVAGSGIAGYDRVQLDRFLSGSEVFLTPFIDETNEGFVGFSSTDDVELMLQLLSRYVTDPQVDEVPFRAATESARAWVDQVEVSPVLLSFQEIIRARYENDPYQRFVSDSATIEALTPESVLEIYEARLGKVDDLVVVMVGDLDSDVAEDLMQSYLSVLPEGESDTFVDRWSDPPQEILEFEVSAGDESAGAGIDFLFTGLRPVDERVEIRAEVLGNILSARLFETLREDLGATYGGTVDIAAETIPDHVIETVISVNGDPDRLESIEAVVLEEIADLVENGPTKDEFDRAIAIGLSDYSLVGNQQLIDMLMDSAFETPPDPFSRNEGSEVIESLSQLELKALAGDMFPRDRWIRVARTN